MWLEKAELGQRLALWGVGEELVQDEGLLASQHEQRLSETGPSSTDLHTYTRRHARTVNILIRKRRRKYETKRPFPVFI